MILNCGNIKKKSKILRRYFFDCYDGNDIDGNAAAEYFRFLETIPGIEYYKEIRNNLHDSLVSFKKEQNDVSMELELFGEKNNRRRKTVIFKNARILSYNKVLRSGTISKINRKIIPHEYLYDELYAHGNEYFISIIVTCKNRVKTGIYFPFITIAFKSIDAIKYLTLDLCRSDEDLISTGERR